MQGVGGDGGVFQKFAALLEEFLRDGELAVVLFPAVTGHGDGASVFVAAQGDDGSEGVAEVFAI